jgi:hypothetical protein
VATYGSQLWSSACQSYVKDIDYNYSLPVPNQALAGPAVCCLTAATKWCVGAAVTLSQQRLITDVQLLLT